VEPFEFTSNGGGGVALSRRAKRRNTTFYEVIKLGSLKMKKQEAKPKLRKGKKRPKTAAEKQLNLVDKLMMNVDRIHKRV
jgi:hypothetical protein